MYTTYYTRGANIRPLDNENSTGKVACCLIMLPALYAAIGARLQNSRAR